MITNFETNKVFISTGLTHRFYSRASTNLLDSLRKNDISFSMLPMTDSPLHIWARDFMPVQVTRTKMVRFRYAPDYLMNEPEYKPDTKTILANLGMFVVNSDIILDGGNVISCGDKVILTDKIFKENPHYSRVSLIDSLTNLLEADPVIIPWDKHEEYGHADGMVRYMGEGKVLLNNYCDFDKSLRKKLLDALTPYFEVTELHYGSCTKNSWAYLNFLHVDNHIFVPMLHEELDDMAYNQIKNAFPSCLCHRINEADLFVKNGGALNCVTWNTFDDAQTDSERSITHRCKGYMKVGNMVYLANMVKNFYHDQYGIHSWDSQGNRTEIFLRQGELCNSSATYCFMMMLILNQKLVKDDLGVRYDSNGNSFIDVIRKTFLRSLYGNGRIIEYIDTIEKKLVKLQLDLDVEVYTSIHGIKGKTIPKQQLGIIIEKHLSQKRPVQISCYTIESQLNYSLVVIGFNKVEPNVFMLYCLDPKAPLEATQLSNCTVQVDFNSEHNDKICRYDGRENWANVHEALIVIPENPLFEYLF